MKKKPAERFRFNFVFVDPRRFRCVDCEEFFFESELNYFQPDTHNCLCKKCLSFRVIHSIDVDLVSINQFEEV